MDDSAKAKTTSASGSESEPRLPSNAHAARGNGSGAVPQDIRKPSLSIARATDRLASPPSSLPRSWQPREPRKMASSNGEESDASASCYGDVVGAGRGEPLDEAAIARRVKRHLVTHGPEAGNKVRGSVGGRAAQEAPASASAAQEGQVGGEVDEDGYVGDDNDDEQDSERVPVDPMTLPSGDITYGIYRWHQTHGREDGPRQRRGSFSGVASAADWDMPYSQQQMTMPGGFRRQFLRDQAEREGRVPVGMLTDNFVDFIGLYGHFAGSEYPSDEDESDADDAIVTARTPLVSRQQQQQREAERSIHGSASSRKAFFLLLKAFVGTGVLVLPKAFSNGGLLASVVVVALVAWYAWHCMILLGEVFLATGGSYSGLGTKLLGRWAGRIITVSIVTAQLGFCSAYTIFVATNARSVWDALTGCRYSMSPTFWVLAQLVAYIPLA
ncbi:hypothetical protein LPJ61_001985 [Coemansia biformis]|uniref:Amino acid transporter transmembrane domain-containing protein n=1 Tax=Coemansia biformis TaxID=1286918 RepID=A0A9W8CZK6_9FUNG|nr:hypothetical protein LPJ61_001985 [Coemansia biformis]